MLRDANRRGVITTLHSALLNTCLHFFQKTDSLRLPSQSFVRPNLDLVDQTCSLHFASLSALDQLKSWGIIRHLRTQRLGCHWRISVGAVCQKGDYSNQTEQNRWAGDSKKEACKCWKRERAGRSSIIRSQDSNAETGPDIVSSGHEASNCSEKKRLNIMAHILLPPT